MADRFIKGPQIAEGKTKRIFSIRGRGDLVLVESQNDITAGNGEKHDKWPEKGAQSNQTTCNMFWFLKLTKIPVAFYDKYSVNSFVARYCDMLPFEVVVRREAHGSYLKRHPSFSKGYRFDEPIVEFYLKTKGKMFDGEPIPDDDPYILMQDGNMNLYVASVPLNDQEPFKIISGLPNRWKDMADIAQDVFIILEDEWKKYGLDLVDLKVEFGIDIDGNLLLADVIDNDSWRITKDGKYLDKQVYRDGGNLEEVMANYKLIADASEAFR